MTLRNLLATNFLLAGWAALLILAFITFAAAFGYWPDGLSDGRPAELLFLGAVGVGVGVFLRQDHWQGETNIAALIGDTSAFASLEGTTIPGPDLWPNGLFGVAWLP